MNPTCFAPKTDRRTSTRAARTATLLLLTVSALLAGCGVKRPETIQVRGRITCGGEEWPQPGRLFFVCTEPAEGFPRRPGNAEFGVDGHFQARTWNDTSGLMPGTYKVSVECWRVAPTMEGGGQSLVPEAYQSAGNTPLELTLHPDQEAVELEWDVPKAK